MYEDDGILPLFMDKDIEKPSPWKEHPNFKQQRPPKSGILKHTNAMKSKTVSLYSGKYLPYQEDIQQQLDLFANEDDEISSLSSVNLEVRDDYSYSSYVSYLVETMITDDGIENKYVGLMSIPETRECDGSYARDAVPTSVVKLDPQKRTFHDDENDGDNDDDDDDSNIYDRDDDKEKPENSQQTDFGKLWGTHGCCDQLIETESIFENLDLEVILERLLLNEESDQEPCQPSFNQSLIDDDEAEIFDERICRDEVSNIPHPPNDVSSCLIDEREDVDCVVPISKGCDYSAVSYRSGGNSTVNTLKERKRRLESRFMKNDLYELSERVEVYDHSREYRLRTGTLTSNHDRYITKDEIKIPDDKTSRQREAKGYCGCCGIFSTE